ncbi:hypothetical protein QQF64_015723 [Cirrhinus molitorella]|uniref:Uncharacterized protein n=1 Tax=Cirrhinus molitorella TaxID=172907 RepID=A0ABR3NWR1_9TELE
MISGNQGYGSYQSVLPVSKQLLLTGDSVGIVQRNKGLKSSIIPDHTIDEDIIDNTTRKEGETHRAKTAKDMGTKGKEIKKEIQQRELKIFSGNTSRISRGRFHGSHSLSGRPCIHGDDSVQCSGRRWLTLGADL